MKLTVVEAPKVAESTNRELRVRISERKEIEQSYLNKEGTEDQQRFWEREAKQKWMKGCCGDNAKGEPCTNGWTCNFRHGPGHSTIRTKRKAVTSFQTLSTASGPAMVGLLLSYTRKNCK